MSRFSELPAKKLSPLLAPGEVLLAGVQFEYPMSTSQNPLFRAYLEEHGLDPHADLAYRERAVNGYLGVTDSRLLVAKSPVLFSIKPKHVFIDAPLGECTVEWYDRKSWGAGEARVLHLRAPGDRFASVVVPLKNIGMLRESDRVAIRAQADAIVEAFGDRALEVAPPGEG